jgi:predicted dehydrogenase
LVAAADGRLAGIPDKAGQLARDGVELFGDVMEMFHAMEGRCDAVYIATSIHSHTPLTIAAAKCGYHIHLEKPPAATVQEVDQMIQAVAEAGRMCLVGFHAIHGDDLRFVKDRIVAGRLGRVKRLVCCVGPPRAKNYYCRNEWAGRIRVGGEWVLDGPATNAACHEINIMLFLACDRAGTFAAPAAVRGELYAAGPIESHDTAAIEIQTVQGAVAYLLASHCTQNRLGTTIEVEADGGRATLDTLGTVTIRYADGSEERHSCDPSPRLNMVANFVEAIRTQEAGLLGCSLSDARNTVLAVNGAHESSGEIHRISREFATRLDQGTDKERTVVKDLEGHLVAAAGKRCLLSDLSPAPRWAVATDPYDMCGYSIFPRRFRPK